MYGEKSTAWGKKVKRCRPWGVRHRRWSRNRRALSRRRLVERPQRAASRSTQSPGRATPRVRSGTSWRHPEQKSPCARRAHTVVDLHLKKLALKRPATLRCRHSFDLVPAGWSCTLDQAFFISPALHVAPWSPVYLLKAQQEVVKCVWLFSFNLRAMELCCVTTFTQRSINLLMNASILRLFFCKTTYRN